MHFKILYTHSYNHRATRFFREHPEHVHQYEKTLRLLEANPFHPSLRLYRLHGPLAALHAVSISAAFRLLFEFLMEKSTIMPVDVGAHDDVY